MHWNINNVEYKIENGQKKVFAIHWSCCCENEKHRGDSAGNVTVTQDVDFDTLTRDDAIQMVIDILGPEQVDAIEAANNAQIAEKENPTCGCGIPW